MHKVQLLMRFDSEDEESSREIVQHLVDSVESATGSHVDWEAHRLPSNWGKGKNRRGGIKDADRT